MRSFGLDTHVVGFGRALFYGAKRRAERGDVCYSILPVALVVVVTLVVPVLVVPFLSLVVVSRHEKGNLASICIIQLSRECD